MRFWIGLVLCFAGLVWGNPASAELYHDARSRLIAAGYLPLIYTKRVPYEEPGCVSFRDICEAYPEVGTCSGTGLAPCVFLFYRPKDRTYWEVFSAGEVMRSYTGIRKSSAKNVAEHGQAVIAQRPIKPAPRIREDVAFEHGYEPLALKQGKGFCGDRFCREHQEILNCSKQQPAICEFAYRGDRDKKYYVIKTQGASRAMVVSFGKADVRQMAEIKRRL
jgi:hypothetical protein